LTRVALPAGKGAAAGEKAPAAAPSAGAHATGAAPDLTAQADRAANPYFQPLFGRPSPAGQPPWSRGSPVTPRGSDAGEVRGARGHDRGKAPNERYFEPVFAKVEAGSAAAATMTSRGDSVERQANAAAAAIDRGEAAPSLARAGGGAGLPLSPIARAHIESARKGPAEPLPGDVREEMGAAFGADLSGVRVHTDGSAARAARRLGAGAFTVGRDVVFAEGRYQPGTRAGRSLLAHELAHVVQGAPGAVAREDPPGGESSEPEADTGLFGEPPRECREQTMSIDPTLEPPLWTPDPPPSVVSVTLAHLEAPPRGEPLPTLTLQVPFPVTERHDVTLWAAPSSAVFATTDDLLAAQQMCAAEPESSDAGADPGVSTPRDDPTSNGLFPGMLVVTSEGTARVVAIDGDLVVLDRYVKAAVGAASTTVVVGPDGYYLIDAGVMGAGSGTVADATMQLLREINRTGRFEAVLSSHMHADHTNLVPRVYAEFTIGRLALNYFQALARGSGAGTRADELAAEMLRARADALAARRAQLRIDVAAELDATPQRWDAVVEPSGRAELRAQAIEAEVQRRMPVFGETQLEVNVPVGGRQISETVPLGRLPARLGASPDRAPVLESLEGSGYRTFVDQNLGAWTTDAAGGANRPGAALIDAAANHYIWEFESGFRVIAMPDVRVSGDVPGQPGGYDSLAAARSSFDHALEMSQIQARFVVLDATHHAQSGFYGSTGDTAIVRAQSLMRLADFLYEISTEATTGRLARDVLMVSARVDPANPAYTTYIDPLIPFFMRSMGWDVHVASDVSGTVDGGVGRVGGRHQMVREIVVEGMGSIPVIVGDPLPGAEPADELLRRGTRARSGLRVQVEQAQAELALEPPGSARAGDIGRQVADLNLQIQALESAQIAYLRRMVELLARGRYDRTRPATGAGVDAAAATLDASPEATALRAELVRYGEPEPLQSQRLTGEGRAILGLPEVTGGTAESVEQVSRRRVARAQEAFAAAGPGTAGLVPYVDALTSHADVLTRRIRGLPEADPVRDVLSAELAQTNTAINQTLGASGGVEQVSRAPGTAGTQSIRVVPLPRVTARVTDYSGRVLGGMLVYQVIEGAAETLEAFEEGQANGVELTASIVHAGYGATLGVRMLRGQHVGLRSFGVLAAIDVIETAAGEYSSTEERDTAVSASIVRNGFQLAAMALVQRLSPVLVGRLGPLGALIGIAIVFGIDPMLRALGVYDFLERSFGFMPANVTDVYISLRDDIEQYRATVGLLQLAQRDVDELRAMGAEQPQELRDAAQASVAAYRAEALEERDGILEEFEEAYEEARTSYAGLPELDQLRHQFQLLQYAADPEGSSWLESRRAFEVVEQTMNLDEMSEEDIVGMDQWDELDSKLDDLSSELDDDYDDIDWDDVIEIQGELGLMFSNARYRLDPSSSGGLRSAPLFTEGSPARAIYERELAARDVTLAGLSEQMATHASEWDASRGQPTGPDGLPARPDLAGRGLVDRATPTDPTAQLTRVTDQYERLLSLQPPLPEGLTVERMYEDFLAAGVEYQHFVRRDGDFQDALQRLEAVERMMLDERDRAMRDSAGAGGGDQIALTTLSLRVDALIAARRYTWGYLFPREAEWLTVGRRPDSTDVSEELAAVAGPRPLSVEEAVALTEAHDELGDAHLHGVDNPLDLRPDLLEWASRNPDRLRRFEGEWGGIDLFIVGVPGDDVTESDNVLVGLTGREQSTTHGAYGHTSELEVVPLNARAILLFGSPEPQWVLINYLRQVPRSDLGLPP
jgi:hypothetical protein